MQRKIIYSSLLVFSIIVYACSDGDEEEPQQLICDDVVSLSANIVPIFQTNCAIPTCHVAGGQSPNFEDPSNIRANAAVIGVRVSNMTMPPSRANLPLSDETIEQINCWISQGALDN